MASSDRAEEVMWACGVVPIARPEVGRGRSVSEWASVQASGREMHSRAAGREMRSQAAGREMRSQAVEPCSCAWLRGLARGQAGGVQPGTRISAGCWAGCSARQHVAVQTGAQWPGGLYRTATHGHMDPPVGSQTARGGRSAAMSMEWKPP